MTGRPTSINYQLLEFRYKPNPEFLDIRGKLAEELSANLSFEHWNIAENRIDVFKKDNILRAFVGFRNAGFTSKNSPTMNYFFDNAFKFINKLFTFELFKKGIVIQRIGFRSSFCNSFDGSFEELKDKVYSKYVHVTEDARKIFDDSFKVADVGFNLNSKDKFGNLGTICGPMRKEQLQDYFQGEKNLPETGLFFDLDYWIKPEKELGGEELNKKIKEFSFSEWEMNEKLKGLVLK